MSKLLLITVCPITQKPIALGNLYSATIVWWKQLGNYICPITGQTLGPNPGHDLQGLFPSQVSPFYCAQTLIAQDCESSFLAKNVKLSKFKRLKTMVLEGNDTFPIDLGRHHHNCDIQVRCSTDQVFQDALRWYPIGNVRFLKEEEKQTWNSYSSNLVSLK